MHVAVFEFARHVAGIEADSTEFDPETPDPSSI